MNQQEQTPLRLCGNCRRALPLTEFYLNHRTQLPDNYCKECRKQMARERHRKSIVAKSQQTSGSYPVITRISDRDERLALILRAKQLVRESVMRKRARLMREEERRLQCEYEAEQAALREE